jgi:hypothetical protein
MKKLMIATAAVALAAVAQAGIVVTNCTLHIDSDCPALVFKVTANGKATDAYSKDYTSVGKFKISNGALVMWPKDADNNPDTKGDCCYPMYSLYAEVKVGKATYNVLVPQTPIDSWTLFGKNQDEVYDAILGNSTKNKTYKLDSQLGISASVPAGDEIWLADTIGGTDEVDDFANAAFIATAFGKGTVKVNYKRTCDKCTATPSETKGYEIIPGNYSGWFAGLFEGTNADLCFVCECTDINVFGGTWKAKYDKKTTTWQAAASRVFGSAIQRAMNGDPDNEDDNIE